MTFRTLAVAAALAAFAVPATAPAQPAPASALQAAVDGPLRAEDNKARDVFRHPAATLAFWGIKPGDTVLELNPGGGYWTEILAPYAKGTGGRYVATGADMKDPATPQAAKDSRARFEARFSDEARWGDVQVVDFGAASGPLAAPGTVDVVITARNIHNWMWTPGRLDKVMADAFAALKPGGTLAVEEHRSDPRPMKGQAEDGYVSEASVVAAAAKAGFTLDGRSDVNANPKDAKDHPFGVWTLPPTRRTAARGEPANPAFDRARYDAIGESDRMTLRFRKPG